MTVDEWQAVLQVNLSGPFFMIKAVLDRWSSRGYGRIVNISSVVGESGNFGQANYAAAKAGLIGLTKTVALEVAKQRHHRQRGRAGLHRNRYDQSDAGGGDRNRDRADAGDGSASPKKSRTSCASWSTKNAGYITGAVYNINGGWYM